MYLETRTVRRLLAASALLLCTALPIGFAAAQDTPAKREPVADFLLSNGLDVVVIPDHRAPVVTHMVWYPVGSADDPLGKSGIAHFLEHLMFKGTKKHPPGEFYARSAGLGGQENAFTSYDYTAYFQRVARSTSAR